MHYRYKNSLFAFACFMALSVATISATESDNQARALAERGGGGGHGGGGGYHPQAHSPQGGAGHDYHGNYDHGNYNHDNYNRNNYNHDNWNRNEAGWDAAGWGGGAVDVVPSGEYVLPATPTGSGDMNTLYDYESSQPNPSN